MYSAENTNPLHQVLTVSELTARVKTLIEDVFTDIYVVGEISNARVHPSGHWYFSLKDKESSLPCVSFKSANQAFKFRLEDGLTMVARGRLSVYPPKGAYQMIVSCLEPVGIGDWQLAFEQLKKHLETSGLLDEKRKRPIPIMPARIGVVTSCAGAAIKDVLSALSRRNKNVSIVIAPVRVQGEGSAEEIVQALSDLQSEPSIEVIIIARGGGSVEDLWSFNTEAVALAVARCRVPVIAGIGHESDVTICDLVADMRAPTPTAAAELVAKGRLEILDKCTLLQSKLIGMLSTKLTAYRRLLDRANPLSFLSTYQARLNRDRLKFMQQQERLSASFDRLLSQKRHHWQANREKLITLGPLQVLGRGFSILKNRQGQAIRCQSQVTTGETLEAFLESGKLTLIVQSKTEQWC